MNKKKEILIVPDSFHLLLTRGPDFTVDMETGMSPAQYFLHKREVDQLLVKKQGEDLPGKDLS